MTHSSVIVRRTKFDRAGARNGSGAAQQAQPRSGRDNHNQQQKQRKTMKSLVSTQRPFAGVLLPFAPAAALLLLLLLLPMAPSARAQTQPCSETNGVKFLNVPNTLSGWDVYDSQGVVLADDFSCNTTGPITDIHIWGSWKSDSVGTITNFWLGIYNDIPAVTNGTTVIPSHPGTNLLWEQTFDQNHFSANRYASGNEYFFDPRSSNIIGGDRSEERRV